MTTPACPSDAGYRFPADTSEYAVLYRLQFLGHRIAPYAAMAAV
jgi:hypothetical protein